MIINVKRKKTIGKTLYLIGWMFITLFLVTKYNSYLTTLLDNLINNIFMQVFFPSLATYVIIIIISNITYINSVLNKRRKTYEKIIDTIFFAIIMLGVGYTLEEIIKEKLNIYNLDIYSHQTILVLVETTTIVFVIWQLFLISKKIVKKLINLSNQKIEKEKITNTDKIVEDNIPEKPVDNETNTQQIPTLDTVSDNRIPITNQGNNTNKQIVIYPNTQIPQNSNLNQSNNIPNPDIFNQTPITEKK